MTTLVVALLAAGALDSVFDSGVSSYRAGDYEAAIASWEQLVDQGVQDVALFHNLGNAYFRSGDLGAAIASYERALHMEPTAEGVRENLSLAIRQTERAMPRPQPRNWEESLLFWDGSWGAGTSLAIAIGLWWAAWGLFALRWVVRVPYLRRAAVVCMAVCGVFMASWWAKSHPPSLAVAAVETVPVHYGVGENETVRFELHEGDRVSVEGQREGWVRVRTASGERGWTPRTGVHLVGPPYKAFGRFGSADRPADER